MATPKTPATKRTSAARKTTPKTTTSTSARKKSATAKTDAATPATEAATRAKAVPTAAAPVPKTPVVVETTEPVVSEPAMRKRDLIEAVVIRSGVKKRDAKPVVEALLSVVGEALEEGRELNLPPMGKLKVRRTRKLRNGNVFVTRIRRTTGPKLPEGPKLPDAAE